jgi:hypothetical protein
MLVRRHVPAARLQAAALLSVGVMTGALPAGAAPSATAGTATVQAQQDRVCEIYGRTGAAVARFMLPLTFQDAIAMLNGRNDRLLGQFTEYLLKAFSGEDLVAISRMPSDQFSLLSEAAGASTFSLLMDGTVTSPDGVAAHLSGTCGRLGVSTIIANQRAVKAASESNVGK